MAGLRTAYRALGPVGRLAALAVAACTVILAVSLWHFSTSVLSANAPAAASAGATQGLTAAYESAFGRYLAQIAGRSLFIVPGAPRRADPIVEKAPEPQKGPDKPTSYDGSPIIAMVLDTVWFADGKRLSVGEDPKDDTEVLEVQAPWDAVLRWKGEKFTVSLFARDKLIVKPDEKKPDEVSPGDTKPDVVTAAAPPNATDPSKPGAAKPEAKPETKLADKPAPKPDKPAEPKSDAAPGTPAADPQPGEPEPDSNNRSPEGGR